jgi:hypothetical protein
MVVAKKGMARGGTLWSDPKQRPFLGCRADRTSPNAYDERLENLLGRKLDDGERSEK